MNQERRGTKSNGPSNALQGMPFTSRSTSMISLPQFLLTALVTLSFPVASDAAWVDEGIPVASAVEQQIYPVMVSDGAGGAIIAWQDSRGSDFNIYVQRINQ